MQQFIYILQLNAPFRKDENWTDATREIVSNHFEHLKALTEKGIARVVGKTEYGIDHSDNFGMVIFIAENEETAKTIMNNDPAIKQGIMSAVLHPFKLVLVGKV